MKTKAFTFDSEKIGSGNFIHFEGNPKINFANESTQVSVYADYSIIPYFVNFVEKYIQRINQPDTTYFNIPISHNCNHIEIILIAFTDYDIEKIEESII